MTRETRQYLSRIRKAQDAILNGKANKGTSLHVDVALDDDDDRTVITVYAHSGRYSDDRKCESANLWFGLYTTEEMEAELAECSKLIGVTI